MTPRLFVFALPVIAAAAEESHGAGEDYTVLKWIYAGIFLTGIVWAWNKFVSPAFRARGESIRKELDSARKMKAEADRRVAEIETKLANLSAEVEAFRSEARRLMEAEAQKILQETADQTSRMQQRAEKEIETQTQGALASVRAEAARQAVELARQRIAQGLPAETHRGLIAEFLKDLDSSRN
jgi:F-type H+-transporting ATPase subunit b